VNANFNAGIGTGNLILVDASSGDITITLDSCADIIGIPITIKKIDSSASGVTINPANSETIDSVLTYTIRVQYDICTIVSDGVNWNVI
jgi:SOS-response transcriptional repressor LexA